MKKSTNLNCKKAETLERRRKKIAGKKCFYIFFLHLRRLVFDHSSPVNPVSESMWRVARALRNRIEDVNPFV